MSQAKVEQYKKEKANRKKTMARQKAARLCAKIAATVAAVAIVAWIGTSTYNYYEAQQPAETYYCNTDALDEYINALSE